MPVTRPSSQRPSRTYRALVVLGLPALLAIGLADSPFAQSGPGPGGMGPPHGGHRMPSLEALDGPPSPQILRDSIQVSGDKLRQYSSRYESHMAATKPARDSLRANLQAIRSAFESGDRSAAGERREAVQRQSKELANQDQKFDEGLKDILTKDQQIRYDKWKENHQKSQREQWRRDRHRPGGREGWNYQMR